MTARGHDLRLAAPAAGVWVGAAVGAYLSLRVVAVAGVVVTAVAIAAWVGNHHLVAAVVVGAVLGIAAASMHEDLARTSSVAGAARKQSHAVVQMRLVRDPAPRVSAAGFRYVVAAATVQRLNGRPANAAVLVIAHGSAWQQLLPGQRLSAHVRLEPPQGHDGLSAVALVSGEPALLGRPPWWQRFAGAVRAKLRAACAGLPPDARGLVPGLVVGDVSAMPPALTAAFQRSGLTHLNAVSGENCAIVLTTIGAVLRRTPVRRRWRHVVLVVSLGVFVLVARPSPSVLRAAVMGVAAVIGAAIGRRTQPMPALSAAVLVLLLVNPFLATNPGFALSVVATAGIVLAARPLTDRLAARMPRAVAAAVAVPVVAQLACTPLLILYFGQLTPWAVPANLLAAPAVAPATILGVVAAAVAVVTTQLGQWLAWGAAVPAGWLAVVARLFGGLPGSGAHAPPWTVLLLVTAALAVVVVRRLTSTPHAMLGPWR